EQRLVTSGPSYEGKPDGAAGSHSRRDGDLRQPGMTGEARKAESARAEFREGSAIGDVALGRERRRRREHDQRPWRDPGEQVVGNLVAQGAGSLGFGQRDSCRHLEALLDAGSELYVVRLNEGQQRGLDLEALDEAEGIAPGGDFFLAGNLHVLR